MRKRSFVTIQPKPREILIREFQDVRHRGHAANTSEVGGLILDEARADIGIERDHTLFVLALQQRFVGGAAGLRDQADGAEMQRFAVVTQYRQVELRDHPSCRAFIVEGVGRMSVDQFDECDRRRARGKRTITEINIAPAQCIPQDVAHHVVSKTREETCLDTQTTKRNGRVEHCTAGIGRKARFAERGFSRQHVDKRFTATQDHDCPLPDKGLHQMRQFTNKRQVLRKEPVFKARKTAPQRCSAARIIPAASG